MKKQEVKEHRERIQVMPVVQHVDERVWKDGDKLVLMTSMTQEQRNVAFSQLSKSVLRAQKHLNKMKTVLKQLEEVSQERGQRIAIKNELLDEILNEA